MPVTTAAGRSSKLKPLKLTNGNVLAINKVAPLTGRRELFSLSFCDIRRIAAVRAKERLQQLILKQRKGIRKGRIKLNSRVSASLLPSVSLHQAAAIEATWSYFIRDMELAGLRMLIFMFEKDPSQLNFFPKLRAAVEVGGFHSLRHHPKAIQYGRSFIMHITDIIANLRNNAALQDLIERKFAALRKAGYTRSKVDINRDRLRLYLKDALATKWTPIMAEAWRALITGVVDIGLSSWGPEPLADGTTDLAGRDEKITLPPRPNSV